MGCLALGITAVTSDKQAVETAFRRAWRDWGWSSTLPTIHASFERNDLLRILHASSRRRGGYVAYWACEREYQPQLREGWGVHEAAATVGHSTGVPATGWLALSRAFAEGLGEAQIRRDDSDVVADDIDDDDMSARGLDDDSGYGEDSCFAHTMRNDDSADARASVVRHAL